MSSSSLPAGLALSASGAVTGTPTTVGVASFTVQVTSAGEMATLSLAYTSLTTTCTSGVTNMSAMFDSATAFNEDIGSWDVSSVKNMVAMFYNATAFNQDLGSWCVTSIPAQPDSFDFGTTSWVLPRPVWGTCPGG